MSKEHIFVIEDEEDIQELVRYNLARDGFRVTCVSSGEEGLKLARSLKPQLILLDLMLPGMQGFEVCKKLRADEELKSIPIIMLTAKGEETDMITGLELGADDYLAKPFSPKVLIARIKAVLRRETQQVRSENETVKIKDLVIDPKRHEVTLEDKPLVLTNSEFRILHFLAKKPGWVFSRYQIVDAVHGDDYPVTERSVDVQIVGLRKKLGSLGEYIETVRGVGYRFKE